MAVILSDKDFEKLGFIRTNKKYYYNHGDDNKYLKKIGKWDYILTYSNENILNLYLIFNSESEEEYEIDKIKGFIVKKESDLAFLLDRIKYEA